MTVVGIVSFITISTITGFQISSQRLNFQNQLQALQSFITSHKAAGFNDTSDNNDYTVNIEQTSVNARVLNSTTGLNTSEKTFLISDEEMIFQNFNVRNSESVWESLCTQNAQQIDCADVDISIDPQQRVCNISSDGTDYLTLHIAINKPDELTPSKHLYIHRENCLIESINNQIQN